MTDWNKQNMNTEIIKDNENTTSMQSKIHHKDGIS